MGKFLIPVLIVLAASAAVTFSGLFDQPRLALFANHFKRLGLTCLSRFSVWVHHNCESLIGQFGLSNLFGRLKTRVSPAAACVPGSESSTLTDIRILNCRVRRAKLKEEDRAFDVFNVEICGSIHAASDAYQAALKVSILDVTDGDPRAVQTQVKQGASPDGPTMSPFCHRAELGKLPHQVTILSDWTGVARLHLDGLLFPRKGRRSLQFDTSILSARTGQQLARAQCTFAYDNPSFGYVDLQEHAERTKVLAVALAFAVGAADGNLYDCEIELIKNWARDNILDNPEQACDQDGRTLEKALSKTVAFFRAGNKLDGHGICRELLEIAPVGQRYDILELCLYVARASGSVAAEDLAILKDLASWLELDRERFRTMMEKVLPVEMHQVKDIETVLGITSDMSKERVRRHLNKEYSKWNSRVTNADPGIQTQADQMLKLIAETRSQYTSEQRALQEDTRVSTR
jgi:hypothetical protein